MPVLESLAAALGIVDIGLRSISLLYDSIKELKSAPKVILELKDEIETLRKCLSGLEELLKLADDSIHALVQRFGLPEAAKSCADTCGILHQDISRWATTQKLSIRARLHFLTRRKDIISVVKDISTAKETTILTAVITNLALQMSGSAPNSKRKIVLSDAEAAIAIVSANAQERGDEDTTQAARKAEKEVDNMKQNWEGRVTTDGSCNEIGISGKMGDSRDVKQIWKGEVETNGKDNKVGISGKGGDSGNVRQNWSKDVKTRGDGNSVGIISK